MSLLRVMPFPSPDSVFFDSGIGGLRMLRECMRFFNNELRERDLNTYPEVYFVYVADTVRFPYSQMTVDQVLQRKGELLDFFYPKEQRSTFPLFRVFACHSLASHQHKFEVVRKSLASSFSLNMMPAINEVIDLSTSQHILVLCTPITGKSAYVQQVQNNLQPGQNCVVVSPKELAALSEERFFAQSLFRHQNMVDQENKIAQEIEQALLDNPKIDVILLACTHYIFSESFIHQVASKTLGIPKVPIVDSAMIRLAQNEEYLISVLDKIIENNPCNSLKPSFRVMIFSGYQHNQIKRIVKYLRDDGYPVDISHCNLQTCLS
ncbi:MAG: hypothetical protein OXC40_03740 [Proteobacteria bacterium]|nr:hypothetical protein [Pseudomonadota bacterium]